MTVNPTHEVFFADGSQRIGSVPVVVMEQRDGDEDMLEAAAVAQNAVKHWDVVVKRVADGKEETFSAYDATDWWA